MTSEEFGKIYEKRHHDWVGLAFQKLRNQAQAEDAVHDALMTYIFPRLEKLTAKNMDSYVRQAIVWYIKRFIWLTGTAEWLGNRVEERRQFDNPESFEDLDEEIVIEPSEEISSEETTTPLERSIREALASLSDDEQELIILRVFAGLPFAEISKRLNLPAGERKTYQRALQKLRLALESVGISDQTFFGNTELLKDETAA